MFNSVHCYQPADNSTVRVKKVDHKIFLLFRKKTRHDNFMFLGERDEEQIWA